MIVSLQAVCLGDFCSNNRIDSYHVFTEFIDFLCFLIIFYFMYYYYLTALCIIIYE